MAERICMECGEKLLGRIDKKFCSDYCRNSFHNKQNSDQNARVRQISHILRKNRRILETLNKRGKTIVKKKKLIEKGYDFYYHTHSYTTSKKVTYVFCFDQGYCEMEKEAVLIVRDNSK